MGVVLCVRAVPGRQLSDRSAKNRRGNVSGQLSVGSGQNRLHLARDEHELYFRAHPGETDREYLLAIFDELARLPGGEVFQHQLSVLSLPTTDNCQLTTDNCRNWLSGDAAGELLRFFQRIDANTGDLIHDFTDPRWDTRFLGDLYQDLSEAARKKYALLQTPEFVEEFILDRTLEPAIDEFGLVTGHLSLVTGHSSSVAASEANDQGPMTNDEGRTIGEDLLTREQLDQRTKTQIGDIPVPPKYTSADFISSGGARYWALRGKLDVPKERWISFPHCEGPDGTQVIAWAGYDHLQLARAISAYYVEIQEHLGGRDDSRLVPLLACVIELLPWLRQWHHDLDPDFDQRMDEFFEGFVAEEAKALNMTVEEVKRWKPPKRGGRRGKTG